MKVKTIASTETQNNFGRILDEMVQYQTSYVVTRRNIPQAIMVSLYSLERLLENEDERNNLLRLLQTLSSAESLGETIVQSD